MRQVSAAHPRAPVLKLTLLRTYVRTRRFTVMTRATVLKKKSCAHTVFFSKKKKKKIDQGVSPFYPPSVTVLLMRAGASAGAGVSASASDCRRAPRCVPALRRWVWRAINSTYTVVTSVV